MNKLILMRGLPGSGKSTAAQTVEGAQIYSTDDFWSDGAFDAAKLTVAHDWNRRRVAEAMRHGAKVVIVDNTNILIEHMEPYGKLAKRYGYAVKVWTVGAFDRRSIETYYNRQLHKCPLGTMERMAREFEPIPLGRNLLDFVSL